MKVLMISTDRKILEEGSVVRARMCEYGTLFDELHIVVFSPRDYTLNASRYTLAQNVFAYPTCSWSKLFYIYDAIRVGSRILSKRYTLKAKSWIVTCQDPFETGLAGWWLSGVTGLPLELQVHTDIFSPYFGKQSVINRARVFVARLLLPMAGGIRVVSERIKQSLFANCSRLPSLITVVPIFVDVEKFRQASITIDLHKKYPQFDFIILMASRLSPEKDIPLALGAFAVVLKKYPKTGLVIVGDGPERESLNLKVESHKIGSSVIIEGWQSDMASYYKSADLFLSTSLYEGYGMSLVEAGASGCVIVSSDVGIAPALLPSQARFPVGDKNRATAVVLTCIESSKERKAIQDYIRTHLYEVTYPNKATHLAIFKNTFDSLLLTR